MMTTREICEDDGRSRRGEVELEAISLIRIRISNGVRSKPDLAHEVVFNRQCAQGEADTRLQAVISMGMTGGCRGARSEGEPEARRSGIVSKNEEVEDDCR